jgi:hypothetical protein
MARALQSKTAAPRCRHGGYFEGVLSQQLIYRLACLGYQDTVAAYGSEDALSQMCRDKQIRGLLSPQLAAQRSLRSMTAGPASGPGTNRGTIGLTGVVNTNGGLRRPRGL